MGILRLLATVVLVIVVACGDDDSAPGDAGVRAPRAGRGSVGGRGGGSGGVGASAGVGGRAGNSASGAGGVRARCEEGVHDALSGWCDAREATCGLTFDEQRQRICIQTMCAPPCGVWEWKNSCGGRSIGFSVGVDVHAERYDFDSKGQLVGVEVQRVGKQCIHAIDVFGTPCTMIDSKPADCGAAIDAGL